MITSMDDEFYRKLVDWFNKIGWSPNPPDEDSLPHKIALLIDRYEYDHPYIVPDSQTYKDWLSKSISFITEAILSIEKLTSPSEFNSTGFESDHYIALHELIDAKNRLINESEGRKPLPPPVGVITSIKVDEQITMETKNEV